MLVYRRQPIIKEICRVVGYGGRYCWVVFTPTVHVNAAGYRGNSRLVWQVVDAEVPKVVRFPFENGTIYTNIQWPKVIVAIPTFRNRKRIPVIFMPKTMSLDQADGNRLLPEERAVLQGKLTQFDSVTYQIAQVICRARGLITEKGEITKAGTKLLEVKGKS